MSEITTRAEEGAKEPGQVAYEARYAGFWRDVIAPWRDIGDGQRSAWVYVEKTIAARAESRAASAEAEVEALLETAKEHSRETRDAWDEISRLTAERDAAIKVQEMCAMSGGFNARWAENATKQREAAEAEVERLTRLLKEATVIAECRVSAASDAEYWADQAKAAEASASALRDRVAATLDDACRMSAILLMAGEMTAQERRTAKAVADGIANKVRAALNGGDHE